jgi:hypothetical protein
VSERALSSTVSLKELNYRSLYNQSLYSSCLYSHVYTTLFLHLDTSWEAVSFISFGKMKVIELVLDTTAALWNCDSMIATFAFEECLATWAIASKTSRWQLWLACRETGRAARLPPPRRWDATAPLTEPPRQLRPVAPVAFFCFCTGPCTSVWHNCDGSQINSKEQRRHATPRRLRPSIEIYALTKRTPK